MAKTSIKSLPVKQIFISDRKGRSYITKRHYNPNKVENKTRTQTKIKIDVNRIQRIRQRVRQKTTKDIKLDKKINIIKKDKNAPIIENNKIDHFLELDKYISEKVDKFVDIAKKEISPSQFLDIIAFNHNVAFNKLPILDDIFKHIAGIAYFDHSPSKISKIKQDRILELDIRDKDDAFIVSRDLSILANNKLRVHNSLLTVDKNKYPMLQNLSEKMLLTQTTFLEKYLGKDRYIIDAIAVTYNRDFEGKPEFIGAGIWYYKGMDLLNNKKNRDEFFPYLARVLTASEELIDANSPIQFKLHDTDDQIAQVMLGRLILTTNNIGKNKLQETIKNLLRSIFNVKNEDSLHSLSDQLITYKTLSFKKILQHTAMIHYHVAITSKDKLVSNYKERNR